MSKTYKKDICSYSLLTFVTPLTCQGQVEPIEIIPC